MAEAVKSNMDLLIAQVKKDAADSFSVLQDMRKLSEEELKEEKQGRIRELMALNNMSEGIAEEMVDAFISENKEQNKLAETEKLARERGLAADQVAAKKRQELIEQFGKLGATIRNSFSGLGDAIKDDFNQLGAIFGSLDALPGIKTIKLILGGIALSLTKLLLNALKNSKIIPDFIKDRIAMDEAGVNIKDTLRNFKPDFMLSPEDKRAKKESIKEGADYVAPEGGGDGLLSKMNNKATEMTDNLKKSFGDAQTKVTDFGKNMRGKFTDGIENMGNKFEGVGDTLGKAGGKLKGMGGKLVTGVKGMGKSFMGLAKNLGAAVARMAVAAGSFIAGLAASAVSMLVAAAPLLLKALLIGAAIAILIFAVYWLYKKFVENKDMIMARWEMIKEGFMTAMDGLVLWKDKAVAGIQNIFKKISLGIQNMMVSILEGIEGAINWVIRGINSTLGWAGVDLDEVDIGASGMRASYDEDKAAFEVEKAAQAEEFAAREKDIADRKANNTMERAQSIVTQNNNTVQEGSKQTTVVPSGTTPTDSDASMMALAQ